MIFFIETLNRYENSANWFFIWLWLARISHNPLFQKCRKILGFLLNKLIKNDGSPPPHLRQAQESSIVKWMGYNKSTWIKIQPKPNILLKITSLEKNDTKINKDSGKYPGSTWIFWTLRTQYNETQISRARDLKISTRAVIP